MPIPVDGYIPGQVTYEIHYPWAIEHPVITLDVTLSGQKNMSADDADALVRQHLEALFVDVWAATGEADLTLLRTYHGVRGETITPAP